MSGQEWSLTVSSMLSRTSAACSSVLHSPMWPRTLSLAAPGAALSLGFQCLECLHHAPASQYAHLLWLCHFRDHQQSKPAQNRSKQRLSVGRHLHQEPVREAAADQSRADLAGLLLHPELTLCFHMMVACQHNRQHSTLDIDCSSIDVELARSRNARKAFSTAYSADTGLPVPERSAECK